MNCVPSSYPTTSDISIFMDKILWYEWSNQAQVFYQSRLFTVSYQTINMSLAELIYKRIVGDKPIESYLSSKKQKQWEWQ